MLEWGGGGGGTKVFCRLRYDFVVFELVFGIVQAKMLKRWIFVDETIFLAGVGVGNQVQVVAAVTRGFFVCSPSHAGS